MQIRIDIKSLVAGFVLGAFVFLAMGQALSGAGKTDFGIALPTNGTALVRANDGTVYVVYPSKSRAEMIEHQNGPARGLPLNLNRTILSVEKSAGK